MSFVKKSLIYFLILFSLNCFSQSDIWSVGTAITLDKNDYRYGVFLPFSYGLTESFEVSANVIPFLLVPNISAKKQWTNQRWIIATNHSIHYPSFGLKAAANTEIYDILPDTSIIPQIIAFKNEILISRGFASSKCNAFEKNSDEVRTNANFILTLKLGFQFASIFKDSNFPAINKAYLYHKSSIYHDKNLLYAGIDLDGKFLPKLNYTIDFDFLLSDFKEIALEQKSIIIWNKSSKFSVLLGYKLFYVPPIENQFFIMPFTDFVWTFASAKKLELGLFGRKMF
ncbi:MAG: hypothetical protein HN704_12315 [Bacteroidetes bacterium]|jgi:hypothetical protein|nr:hypothetical protein [Bacteroidota bacterium]MBT6687826.1 hypothetical protein [Bacteroidota bacterium]MBT7142106.1 hypothetical protein [Bacteroidota bacterium]MBT7492377.1 hypothetical protein [Bacteroidota bacterium]